MECDEGMKERISENEQHCQSSPRGKTDEKEGNYSREGKSGENDWKKISNDLAASNIETVLSG